jgi:biopolymer transport protein ExbB
MDQNGALGLAALAGLEGFLDRGGAVIWAIAALSVVTLAVILWKIWRLSAMGAWSRGQAPVAAELWARGDRQAAQRLIAGRRGARARLARFAMAAAADERLDATALREAATIEAKRILAEARSGLRVLELTATVAPLLGLLGTVLGMIAAFQALQEAGARADPSSLAGGIWEALLTTAAGMAVAIPAAIALSWFEGVIDRLRLDMEATATRIVAVRPGHSVRLAAE